jgi:hypothetical protein
VNVRFACPVCERPGRVNLPGPKEWQCPGCDHLLPVAEGAGKGPLEACAACGNRELYKKKDFPHALGMAILLGACVASALTYSAYWITATWAILIGSALFDGLLYLMVGDVVVCYRCDAHHRGMPVLPEHKPHDLGIGERYRQERLRREQLRK